MQTPEIQLPPDYAMAEFFLSILAYEEDITFQTLDDKGDNPALRNVSHGKFRDLAAKLIAYNNQGAGIYFMVNRGDGVIYSGAKTCRTQANVKAIRATFVDLDGSPVAPVIAFDPKPDLVIESSPGKYHAYWLGHYPLDQFEQIQKRLAHNFNGDPAVCDLPRVMRLPGFYHMKRDPVMTKVIGGEEWEKQHGQ